jgi:hypothetical protein
MVQGYEGFMAHGMAGAEADEVIVKLSILARGYKALTSRKRR